MNIDNAIKLLFERKIYEFSAGELFNIIYFEYTQLDMLEITCKGILCNTLEQKDHLYKFITKALELKKHILIDFAYVNKINELFAKDVLGKIYNNYTKSIKYIRLSNLDSDFIRILAQNLK